MPSRPQPAPAPAERSNTGSGWSENVKAARLLPILFGALILLLGLYLVSSHGSIAGVNLPGLLGLPQCDTSSNATPCAGLPLYGGAGVGTVVAIFGLGLLATGFRTTMASAAMGTSGPSGIPPEILASLQTAQARMQVMPPMAPATGAMGIPDPSYKYCSKCGTRTETASRFCKSCGAAI